MEAINGYQLTNSVLRDMNQAVGKALKGDCVFISSAMQYPLDDEFRVAVEAMKRPDGSNHLIVMLETGGGYLETVMRLVSVMRKHYDKVSFVVPSHAYSAGTVLVLSGDFIYMDYYSVLGPIDPQFVDDNGRELLPGAGYLAKFEELTKKINGSKSKSQNATKAELAYLIKRFDPAKLFHIEQSIEHGQSLIVSWLPKYKFKNWKTTKARKKKVTDPMRKKRATDIAKILGKADKWHSHGRDISMRELQDQEIKLEIDDFGSNEQLNAAIRNYHGLCLDFAAQQNVRGFIHTLNGMRRVS